MVLSTGSHFSSTSSTSQSLSSPVTTMSVVGVSVIGSVDGKLGGGSESSLALGRPRSAQEGRLLTTDDFSSVSTGRVVSTLLGGSYCFGAVVMMLLLWQPTLQYHFRHRFPCRGLSNTRH